MGLLRARTAGLFLLSACSSAGPMTELSVCGDLEDSTIDIIRVALRNTRGTEELLTAVARPDEGRANLSLPLSLDIPRIDGPGLISVEARSGGRLVARVTHRTADFAALERADFPLMEACRAFDCGATETCLEGQCVPVRLASETRCP